MKKTPFRNDEDLCASESSDVFTSEGASVSPGPSSTTQSEETLETGSPTTSSFPYLMVSGLTPEQQEELHIRLRVESEDIVDKFWYLHSRVLKSLCEQKVSVDKLVAHLLSLRAFDPVYKGSQKPVLQSFFQELQSAGSIEKVLLIIKDYFSFFNYRVIEHIVDGLGTDQDRVELQNYEKEFDEYSKRRVYECPPEYGSKSTADHADIVMKVDSVHENFTVKELKKFQYRLSGILHVSPQSVLRLCRVEEPSPSIPLPQSPSPPLSLHPSLHYLSYTTETYAHTYTYTHTVQTITQCVQHTVSWDTCPSAAATALADHQQHSTARDPTETDAPLDRYSPHIPPVPLSATGI